MYAGDEAVWIEIHRDELQANGEQRRLDVRPYLAFGVFERLREPAFFALAQPAHGTVIWPGGIDLDPDSVYVESVAVAQSTLA